MSVNFMESGLRIKTAESICFASKTESVGKAGSIRVAYELADMRFEYDRLTSKIQRTYRELRFRGMVEAAEILRDLCTHV